MYIKYTNAGLLARKDPEELISTRMLPAVGIKYIRCLGVDACGSPCH